jgi:hypothetical protein
MRCIFSHNWYGTVWRPLFVTIFFCVKIHFYPRWHDVQSVDCSNVGKGHLRLTIKPKPHPRSRELHVVSSRSWELHVSLPIRSNITLHRLHLLLWLWTPVLVRVTTKRRLMSQTGPRSEHWGGANIAENRRNCSISIVVFSATLIIANVSWSEIHDEVCVSCDASLTFWAKVNRDGVHSWYKLASAAAVLCALGWITVKKSKQILDIFWIDYCCLILDFLDFLGLGWTHSFGLFLYFLKNSFGLLGGFCDSFRSFWLFWTLFDSFRPFWSLFVPFRLFLTFYFRFNPRAVRPRSKWSGWCRHIAMEDEQ